MRYEKHPLEHEDESRDSEVASSGEGHPVTTSALENQRANLLKARVLQQEAVAELGKLALAHFDLQSLFDEAVRLLADRLSVEFAKVLELLPDGSELLLRSGVGWTGGLVGQATVGTGQNSQAGFTLMTQEAVIVEDLRTETRFSGPPLLTDHGVVSGMSTIIRGTDRPYGVLGIHTRTPRRFTGDDVYFLRSVANILAMAVDRQRTIAELHRRHQEFRALAENAPDIISRFDRQSRHLYVNRAIEQYTGIAASAFIGKSNRELGMGEEYVSEWETVIGEVFDSGDERWYEFSFDNDAGRHWFQGRLVPEFDQNGSVRSVLGVVRDVTTQREAIEQLRESEERFRSLSMTSPIGIVVSDTSGNLTYLNEQCEEITGVAIDDALGQGWLSFIHEEDRDPFLDECDRAFSVGEDVEMEVRVKAPGRPETWVLLRATAVQGDSGRPISYVATVQDVTERKTVERHLRYLAEAGGLFTESLDIEKTAQTITDLAIPGLADYCMVQIYDIDGQLSKVVVAHRDPERGPNITDAYSKHIPYYREPHPMARVLRTRQPVFIPEIDESKWESFATNAEHLEVIRMFAPRSLIILPMIAHNQFLGAISFLYSDSGRRYTEMDLELASDLADRAALAIDNARLYEEAQQAIRNREEFLSIASHELKTPLTSVKGYAQLLEMAAATEKLSPERVRNAAARVHEQVARLEALINDLLDVSRIQQGQLELRLSRFDLAELARSVVERFEEGADISPTHALHVAAPDPVFGLWDAERLDQVLTNLLSNALKYSPDGGRIDVDVACKDSVAILAVRDQGIGIPPEEQRKLFQPFQRTHQVQRGITGTGLGLFIVRQIVEQHGGEVQVDSREGEGSRFVVLLPMDTSAH
jgi:PAS domain S-box-containing protein